MQIFCGTDIIEISRIKQAIIASQNFLERVYTKQEAEYCETRKNSKYQSYSGKFAAKEALVKALGTGFSGGICLKDIEILNNESGAPYTVLHGKAREVFEKSGGETISLSISHCREYAVAFVVIQTGLKGETI